MPRSMKFSVKKLTELIKKNRGDHRKLFEQAQQGYRKALIRELDLMLKEARERKRYRRAVELVEPMDMTREYDQILAMLELTTDADIELSQDEFARYVLDDWDWKERVTMTNRSYVG